MLQGTCAWMNKRPPLDRSACIRDEAATETTTDSALSVSSVALCEVNDSKQGVRI